MSTTDKPDLEYVCKLIHESLKLPVFCRFDNGLPWESIWISGLPKHPRFADPVDLYHSALGQGIHPHPVIHETNYLESFAVIPVKRDSEVLAVILIGPAIRQHNEDFQSEFLQDQGVPAGERSTWTEYWRCLPFIDHLQLLHSCAMVNWMVNQEKLDITDVLQASIRYDSPALRQEKELELANRREFSIFHDGIPGAQQMLDLIRRGEKNELIKQLIKASNEDNQPGIQSKRSLLRSIKNLAICGIALSSNAASEGGLYEETAMTLCDLHVQHIEELNDLASVRSAAIASVVDFADRVRQCRNQNVSKPVQISKEYIYLHLFEEITLQQLSDVSGLNPHYLSQLFKKETGLTLIHYIQNERIEEAKKLLHHSNDTISSIGARLTFYDQAHFVKVFRKHAGMTPSQYRNRNKH